MTVTTQPHPYEDKLMELAYGELSGVEAGAIQAHVEECERCAKALSEIRSVREVMGQLPMDPVPDTGLESLFAYADQAARRNAAGPATSTGWRRWLAPLVAMSALGVVAVVAFETHKLEKPIAPSKEEVATGKLNANEQAMLGASSPSPQYAAPASAPSPFERREEKEASRGADEFKPEPADKEMDAVAQKPSVAKAKKVADRYDSQSNSGDFGGLAAAPSKMKGGAKDLRPAAEPTPPAVEEGAENQLAESMGRKQETSEKNVPAMQRAPSPSEGERLSESSRQSLGVQLGNAGGGTFGAGGRGTESLSKREKKSDARETAMLDQPKTRSAPPAPAAGAPPAPKEAVAEEKSAAGKAVADSKSMDDGALYGSQAGPSQQQARRDVRADVERAITELKESPARSDRRLASLRTACFGYLELGMEEKAEALCQQLDREFPKSQEAAAFRSYRARKAVQMAPAKE